MSPSSVTLETPKKLRSDITAEELLRALIALCYMNDRPGWQATVLHLVDIFVDGLRVLRPE